MDVFEAVYTRRSIRSFTDAPVSDDDVQKILDAAMAAPSAGNAQPWEFLVTRDQAKKNGIASVNKYAAMAPHSQVCIAVCADPSREKHPGYWPQDCAAAIQNMLLAARALGIGSVWTGVYPYEEEMRQMQPILGIPAHIPIVAVVVLGYPDQPFKEKHRFNPARVHQEVW